MALDRDLQSIQEVRDLMKKAVAAQKEFQSWDQGRVNALVKAIADACIAKAEPLAKMANEETGFGIWQDKVIKNLLGSKITYEYIKDMKTVGVIREDREKKLLEIAVPVGVVAALIPSTNPTSTTMYKTLISVKAGNAIVVSPHPNAKKCILETVRIIQEAAKAAGAPDGLIQCIETTTMQATDTLMKHPDTGIILATGGSAVAAIQFLKNYECRSIKLMNILAAPEGIQAVRTAHPDVDIYVAAVDEKLNDHGYIVPGLGDAGDRIFGTK